MLKPGPNFKMSKQSKRFLATIVDPQKRALIKAGTVQSELAAAIQPRVSRERRNDKGTE